MDRLCAMALLLLLVPTAFADDWPQWLGPKRDGGTAETIKAWKEAPKVLWKMPVGHAFSSPVVADGRVFVHFEVKDKDEEAVVAFDAKSGKELWRDVYERGVYRSAVGTGPRATPTVAGGRLFTLGVTGILSCYQADTGKPIWREDLYRKFDATLPAFGVCCSPLVVGNRILLSVGGKGRCLVCLDTDKGEVKWQALDEGASSASPVLFAGGPRPRGALPDAVFMTPLRLVGVNPLDGVVRWEYPMVFQPAGTSPTPIVSGDRVVAGTIDNGSTAVQVGAEKDKTEAKQAWQDKDFTVYFSSGVAFGPDQLCLVTNVLQPIPSATLRCVEAKSGKEVWKKTGIGYFHAALLRTGDGKLLILDDAGTLRLAEADTTGYRELCKAKVCGGTLIAPALANGLLFARDDKELVCVQLVE